MREALRVTPESIAAAKAACEAERIAAGLVVRDDGTFDPQGLRKPMNHDMRDWPLKLRINAAAARLASAVYYAKAEAFGGEHLHWEALDVMVRHQYLERAAELLKTLQPPAPVFATGLRQTANRVVGAIFPKDVQR